MDFNMNAPSTFDPNHPTVVQKYGGSSLADPSAIQRVADTVVERVQHLAHLVLLNQCAKVRVRLDDGASGGDTKVLRGGGGVAINEKLTLACRRDHDGNIITRTP